MAEKTPRKRRQYPGFNFDPKAKLAHFDLTVPKTKGKERRRQTVEAATRDVALSKWKTFRESLKRPAPKTFGEYIERFWPLIAKRASAGTATTNGGIIKCRLLPFFRDTRLEDINGSLLKDFVGKLRTEGYRHVSTFERKGKKITRTFAGSYSAAAINQSLAVLRMILRDAVERGELEKYPIRGGLPMQKTTRLRLELSTEELGLFLGAFEDEAGFRRAVSAERSRGTVATSPHFGGKPRSFGGGRLEDGEALGEHFERFRWSRIVFVVALETGLSKGDLLGLKWSVVDFVNGWIRVPRQKTGVESLIPLSVACREALEEAKKRAPFSELVFTTPILKDGRITSTGEPYSEATILRHFAIAKQIAGITRRFRFHDQRHSFASRLASRGVGLLEIANALGHTTARMSERYARPSEVAMRSIARALNADFDSTFDSEQKRKAANASKKAVTPQVSGSYMERVMGIEPTTFSLGSPSPAITYGPDASGPLGTAHSSGPDPTRENVPERPEGSLGPVFDPTFDTPDDE